MSKENGNLGLVTVQTDVLLVIAEARAMRKKGQTKEAFALMEDRLKLLAEMLTQPEEAAIGDLVGMIAEVQGVEESDVYLWLRSLTESKAQPQVGTRETEE